MAGGEITWVIVAMATVQAIHAIFTAWFAAMESQCQHNLRMLKHEVANMRHLMSLEGKANRAAIASNRDAIEDVSRKMGGNGSQPPPSPP